MSGLQIDVDRLTITVSGVSSLVVEQAMAGLADVLRRKIGTSPLAATAGAAVATLSVGPIDVPPRINAAQLRSLIAEQLLEAIVQVGEGGI